MKRRLVLAGIAGIAAAAAGAAWKFHLFGPTYPPTPYDDLLNQIADRRPARIFGAAARKSLPQADAAHLARALRGWPSLSALAVSDAGHGDVVEVAGWVVPRSVALYAALAASV